MSDYKRPNGLRMAYRGMNTVLPPDALPEGKVPFAQNVRAYQDGAIGPRLPQDAALITTPFPVTSLRRLNDSTPGGPVAGFALVAGGGGQLFVGGLSVGVGFSGKRMSMVSYRPNSSVQPWMYVADSNKGVKVNANGLVANTGIAEPQTPVTAFLPAIGAQFKDLARFESPGFWTQFGTFLGPLLAVQRWTGGPGVINNPVLAAYVSPQGGEYDVITSNDPAGFGVTPFQVLPVFGISDVLVEAVPPRPTNVTIGAIVYDSGTTGWATITTSPLPVTPGTNLSAYLIGGTEYAVIQNILTGPAGASIIRMFLTKTHAVGEAMVGQFNTRVVCVADPTQGFVVGQLALAQGQVAGSIGLPGGVQTYQAQSGVMSSGRLIQPSDSIHFQVMVQNPANVSTVKIIFNLDPIMLDFATNTLSVTFNGPLVGGWNDLVVAVNALVRTGNNTDLSLATGITGIRIEWISTGGGFNVQYGEIVVVGGYGPQVTAQENPVTYFAVARSSVTGALSNPSPPMRTGIIPPPPFGSAVIAQIPPLAYDPQIDKVDFYRDGGSLQNPTYAGTVPNNLALSVLTFVDTLDDLTIANNPILQLDNFEPFPSIDLPASGVVSVSGFTVTWTSGKKFNTRWAPGTLININGVSYNLYNRPQSQTSLTILQNGGTQVAAPYTITVPTLLAQRLPALWGPTDSAGFFFAVGDPLRPGTLYFTKGNNPDSAPDTNQIELTSPSEPLINGCLIDGLSLAFSTERAWLLYPNFAQAVATVTGVAGQLFTPIETITGFGLYCKEGICTDGGGNCWFISKEGIRHSNGSGSESITDEDLYTLFPHEGVPQKPYTFAGKLINPPDYGNPDGMALRWAEGYVYFDYQDAGGSWWTLVYDTVYKAWSLDSYAFPASIHADNEGQAVGTIMGCIDGIVRPLTGQGAEIATWQLATPAFDGGEERAQKHFGDIYIEIAIAAGKSVALDFWQDRYTTHLVGVANPAALAAATPARKGFIVDLAAGLGVYALDLGTIFSGPLTAPVTQGTTLLYIWQPSLVPQPETTGERVTDWEDGGYTGAKLVQGVRITADSMNVAKPLQVQAADDLSTHTFAEGNGTWNGQSTLAFSFAVPFVAHLMRTLSTDQTPWKKWNIEYIFSPYPELVKEWHTEGTSHGIEGWQHAKEVNFAHISTADVQLTLVPDNGAPFTVTIPNSGGVQTKTLVTFPANKFKIVSYNASSAAGFRLWVNDIEVKVKQWGSEGPYQVVRPFGGPSQLQAEV